MMEYPHPDEGQRRQIAAEVALDPKQVKFWFQNRRTQLKHQHHRTDNTILRIENKRIEDENLCLSEVLKNILCLSCGGTPCTKQEHESCIHRMLLENAQLKEEYQKVISFLASYLEKQVLQPKLLQTLTTPQIIGSSNDPAIGTSQNQAVDEGPSFHQSFRSPILDGNILLPNLTIESENMEKEMISKVVATAVDELIKLLRFNEPLWIKSSTQDGKLILHHESYERIFPRANHFKGANGRLESSKDSGIVSMSGMQLVDIFLDVDKWINIFPTIVTKAETIQIFESGLVENRSGALQLMFEVMHILSPLVPSREFLFLRYCHQVEDGVWVITDVSYNSHRQNTHSLSRSWKHPSGCLIQDLHNGCSMVTWVEHVESHDKFQTHRLYRDLVNTTNGYGAERWIMELQRVCERFACLPVENIPNHYYGGVINSPEGRRSVMDLSHRMVKIFCGSLNMSGLEFPHLTVENNSGVKVSVRKSTEPGQPNGTVFIAATSLCLPLHYQKVFEFLTDAKRRDQWDVLYGANGVHEIAQISYGSHPSNHISIIESFMPNENNFLILQESFEDPMGSYVVYALIDISALNVAINGEDSSMIPILPSGFVVSGDGKPNAFSEAFSNENNVASSGGSLLTMAFQTLACSPVELRHQATIQSVASINTLLTSTVQKVKDALHCNI